MGIEACAEHEPAAYHGGALDAARARYPHAPEPWVDLSTGVNPCAYPFAAPPLATWARLPDEAALAALLAAAAHRYGADPASIVAAPGTQAIIQALPRLIPARTVGVLGFTYAEHARVWRAAGARVRCSDDLAALADCEVVVVTNPNNPDGRLVPPAALAAVADRATLIVDEAFMDVADADASLAPRVPRRRAIVLRSFGKMYGLAGLRLGFAIASADLGGPLRAALGPWAVSGPALAIGAQALADDGWIARERRRLADDAGRLGALLQAARLTLIGGTSLYRLAAHADAGRLFITLAGAGVLVRPFPERPQWLRFGIPGGESAWARLEAALHSAGS